MPESRTRSHRACARPRRIYWLGMRSRADCLIVRRAIADGYVLVTNNTTDFRALFRREEVHAGLVCINVAPGLMSLDVQNPTNSKQIHIE
jgi:Domain of unknown function (DUF5615)